MVNRTIRFIVGCSIFVTLLLIGAPDSLAQKQAKEAVAASPTTTASPAPAPQTASPEADLLAAPSTVSAPSDKGIPLPQIADSADDLDRQLYDISKQLTTAPDLAEADRATRTQAEEITQRALSVRALLEGQPNAAELADEELYWRNLSQQSANQRKQLSARASTLEGQIRELDEQQLKWQATWDQIQSTPGIETVAARVQQELDAIRVTRSNAQNQLKLVLTLQTQISRSSRQISDSLAELSAAKEEFRGQIFQRDSNPLWTKGAFQEGGRPLGDALRRSADRDFATAGEFLRAKILLVCLFVVFFLVGLILAFKVRTYLGDGTRAGTPTGAYQVFSRPYSVALMFALLVMVGQTISAPVSVGAVLYILWMIVTIRLLPQLIEPDLWPLLYTLGICNVLGGLRVWIPFSPLVKRGLLTLGVAAALTAFAWLSRPSRIRRLRMPRQKQLLLVTTIQVGLVMLFTALLLNVCGYVSLSHVLGLGTLFSAIFISALYSVNRILCLSLTIAMHSPLTSRLSEVQRQQTEYWGHRAFLVIGVIIWVRFELSVFLIYQYVVDFFDAVLDHPLNLGKLEFTIGILLSVVLILAIGFALSKASTLLIRSVLVSKFPLQRGLPYAISKVIYYGLMVVVTYAAITQAGVELNKFTVITGALGVGVGFGLQNIVNNFASGLILLFERPIRVDDTVEVNNLVGVVRRIGARSSTIQTFQGAEVIVPNSNLVSNQVINWTLSSPWRRVEIQVGVAYGSDLDEVLKLLVIVAEKNDGVMREPRPAAFFVGFGDSALNFELRFWSARQDNWFQLKSDVAVALSNSLREAGIEIPFPQRDLHLRTVDSLSKESLAVVEGGNPRVDLVASEKTKPS